MPLTAVDLLNGSVRGDVAFVRQALADGVEVDAQRYSRGQTTLMEVAAMGHDDIIDLLLSAGADLEAKSDEQMTPLMFAVYRQRTEAVSKLLSAGANVNAMAWDGSSVVMMGMDTECGATILHLLLDANANINYVSEDMRSALSEACKHKDHDVVKILLEAGADVNLCQNSLIPAARNGHLVVVRHLLTMGVHVNQVDNINHDTALTVAARKGWIEITQALLAVDGIHIDHANNDGDTALISAAFKKRNDIVRLLLEAGANPHHVNHKQRSALFWVSSLGPTDLVEMLLAQRVDVDVPTRDGATPLHGASRYGNVEIVEMLLTTGVVNVNSQTNLRETALYLAAKNGFVSVVNVLIAHGADLELSLTDGLTPLVAACYKYHVDVVLVLVASGAQICETAQEFLSKVSKQKNA